MSAVKGCVSKALSLLLGNWFISSKLLPSAMYQGMAGFGMGQRHSCEVADVAFLVRCEANSMLQLGVHRHFKILGFKRYKEDITIVSNDRYLFRIHFVVVVVTRS